MLFFYDAIVSHKVAFERLLDDGERFLDRIFQGFDDRREHAQLMHIATDGESYGHHHPHGDMALAYVLDRLAQHPDVRLTNYGEFLELHPPEWEVEIHENSSWSCAHGVERWRSDCGCRFARRLAPAMARAAPRAPSTGSRRSSTTSSPPAGASASPNPWAARNAYIEVILDRDRDAAIRTFLSQHGHPDLDDVQVIDALRLLEMQQDAMLMFTSCGWFHDELSGIETVQCLQYAARAIHLARQFGRDFEPEFVAALEEAPSNVARYRDGRGVWEQLVRPGVVDLERVLAHHAISLIYGRPRPAKPRPRARVRPGDDRPRGPQPGRRPPGRRPAARPVAADLERGRGPVRRPPLRRPRLPRRPQPGAVSRSRSHSRPSRPSCSRPIERARWPTSPAWSRGEFPGRAHRLDDLFRDEQRRIIGIVLEDRFADYRRSFERLADQDEELLNRLGHLSYPIPKPLHAAASTFLDSHLRDEIARLVRGEAASLDAIERLCERGRAWGYQPERDLLEKTLAESLLQTLDEIHADADLTGITARAEQLLAAASLLGLEPDLWQVQNRLLNAFTRVTRIAR